LCLFRAVGADLILLAVFDEIDQVGEYSVQFGFDDFAAFPVDIQAAANRIKNIGIIHFLSGLGGKISEQENVFPVGGKMVEDIALVFLRHAKDDICIFNEVF